MSESKAIIKNADMPEDVQQEESQIIKKTKLICTFLKTRDDTK
jgi:hypothetical protein